MPELLHIVKMVAIPALVLIIIVLLLRKGRSLLYRGELFNPKAARWHLEALRTNLARQLGVRAEWFDALPVDNVVRAPDEGDIARIVDKGQLVSPSVLGNFIDSNLPYAFMYNYPDVSQYAGRSILVAFRILEAYIADEPRTGTFERLCMHYDKWKPRFAQMKEIEFLSDRVFTLLRRLDEEMAARSKVAVAPEVKEVKSPVQERFLWVYYKVYNWREELLPGVRNYFYETVYVPARDNVKYFRPKPRTIIYIILVVIAAALLIWGFIRLRGGIIEDSALGQGPIIQGSRWMYSQLPGLRLGQGGIVLALQGACQGLLFQGARLGEFSVQTLLAVSRVQ